MKPAANIAAALLLTTTFGGCQTSSNLPTLLAVSIPAACESVLVAVRVPGAKAGDDFRVLYLRAAAAARLANATIVSGRQCIARQRDAYRGRT
jgi:hypothetical protein